jgi:hypothetical protein
LRLNKFHLCGRALLADRNVDLPQTHDLLELIAPVDDAEYQIPVAEVELDQLTPFTVMLPPCFALLRA